MKPADRSVANLLSNKPTAVSLHPYTASYYYNKELMLVFPVAFFFAGFSICLEHLQKRSTKLTMIQRKTKN